MKNQNSKREGERYISLEKKVDEYRQWCLSDKNLDPFRMNNAYWAAGYQQFLTWLKFEKK